AQRLSEQRPENMPPLNVLIQINISDEESKSGILLAELDDLAARIDSLPHLALRGLMAIPAPENNVGHQIVIFRKMEHAFTQLKAQYSQIDTLSMGMTDDMEAAITCGSTLVRIGTAIF
ncbi:YggS family pyridoxal phosphate-dependent enzyme, partial [Xenorhabdus bovienii]|uniref:YggS family pyridoxal phosphate-dependent enzyme n=2 Tax=Xenorhabdus TaxID=626 RepID=UPI0023B240CA